LTAEFRAIKLYANTELASGEFRRSAPSVLIASVVFTYYKEYQEDLDGRSDGQRSVRSEKGSSIQKEVFPIRVRSVEPDFQMRTWMAVFLT